MNIATTEIPSNQSLPTRRPAWPAFDRSEWQLSVRLGLPIMMTVWINMGMSITDIWLVSWLGPHAVASVAVVSDVCSIIFYFFSGILAGLMPALAAAVANSERSRVQQLWQASWMVCLLCLIVAIPVVWFSPYLLDKLGVPKTLLDAATSYTHLLALNLIPLMAIGVMRSILVAYHRPRVFFYVTVCALPVNALLDVMLIHGIGPFNALGVSGAGWATLVTTSSMAIVVFVLLLRQDFAGGGLLQIYSSNSNIARLIKDCRMALVVGLPIGTTALAEIGVYLGATVLIASLSVDAVAAHTLTLRLAGIAYAVPLALSQVATLRIAQATGPAAAQNVIRTQLQLAVSSGLLLCTILVLSAEPLANLLNDGSQSGAQAAQTACQLILLLAVTELIEPFTSSTTGLLRGRQDTFVPMLFSLAAYWLFSAPLALWLLPRINGDAEPVWLALLLGMCLAGVLLAGRLLRWYRGLNREADA